MPSIIPGWVYALFASLIVGTILVSSCSLATVNVKNEAGSQQLNNISEYVATQSLVLITYVTQNGQNVTQYLNLPSQVRNEVYWVSLTNGASDAWVSSGLGLTANLNQPGIAIPAQVDASGVYVSSYGRPILECCMVNQTITLTLTGD